MQTLKDVVRCRLQAANLLFFRLSSNLIAKNGQTMFKNAVPGRMPVCSRTRGRKRPQGADQRLCRS